MQGGGKIQKRECGVPRASNEQTLRVGVIYLDRQVIVQDLFQDPQPVGGQDRTVSNSRSDGRYEGVWT